MFPEINSYFLLFEKGAFVLGALLYLIFALVVVKQVSMMTKNISDKFNGILVAFSYLHLGFSIFLVFLTLVIL